MNAPNLLIRPDLGRKAYRLRCRFEIEAYPRPEWLEKAKFAAAEWFVKDMEKEGYEYLDKHGFQMKGPFAVPYKMHQLPPAHVFEREQVKAKELTAIIKAGGELPRVSPFDYASTVPTLAEAEKWEFELAGVFVRKTIVFEFNEESS